MNKLALALFAHARFEKSPQCRELLWQIPADERRGLVERINFMLNQREIMQRVEYEVLSLVRAGVAGDDLRGAGNDDLLIERFRPKNAAVPVVVVNLPSLAAYDEITVSQGAAA